MSVHIELVNNLFLSIVAVDLLELRGGGEKEKRKVGCTDFAHCTITCHHTLFNWLAWVHT